MAEGPGRGLSERTRREALLARLGLDLPGAVPQLRTLGAWDEGGPTGPAPLVAEALRAGAHPPAALSTLARLAERRPEDWAALRARPELLRRAGVVAGASDALGDLLVRRREAVDALCGDLAPAGAEAVQRDCVAAMTRASGGEGPGRGGAGSARRLEGAAAALAACQRQGLLRVAA
ncbi:MAG: hypothetical protein KY434_04735, partial [Actinobacteria bacterium]|nr:hypothetical protein [Actinomycetota bacterium]